MKLRFFIVFFFFFFFLFWEKKHYNSTQKNYENVRSQHKKVFENGQLFFFFIFFLMLCSVFTEILVGWPCLFFFVGVKKKSMTLGDAWVPYMHACTPVIDGVENEDLPLRNFRTENTRSASTDITREFTLSVPSSRFSAAPVSDKCVCVVHLSSTGGVFFLLSIFGNFCVGIRHYYNICVEFFFPLFFFFFHLLGKLLILQQILKSSTHHNTRSLIFIWGDLNVYVVP